MTPWGFLKGFMTSSISVRDSDRNSDGELDGSGSARDSANESGGSNSAREPLNSNPPSSGHGNTTSGISGTDTGNDEMSSGLKRLLEGSGVTDDLQDYLSETDLDEIIRVHDEQRSMKKSDEQRRSTDNGHNGDEGEGKAADNLADPESQVQPRTLENAKVLQGVLQRVLLRKIRFGNKIRTRQVEGAKEKYKGKEYMGMCNWRRYFWSCLLCKVYLPAEYMLTARTFSITRKGYRNACCFCGPRCRKPKVSSINTVDLSMVRDVDLEVHRPCLCYCCCCCPYEEEVTIETGTEVVEVRVKEDSEPEALECNLSGGSWLDILRNGVEECQMMQRHV